MADLSKVKVGSTYYNLKDAEARISIAANASAIASEIARASAAESALDTRVNNLEARGRFLSNYNVGTGLPTTYPEVPSGQTSYTYTFKSGDYYIVGSIPASGTKYMPSGTSISTEDGGSTWTVGKKETTETISVGDQFVFDGTNWVHIAAAKDVTWGTIVGTLSDQTDLQNALDAKADTDDLGDLAAKDSASGTSSISTIDSIAMKELTVAGNATVTTTDTAATLTKADYTPAGTVSGKNTASGTVSVVLKDATAEGSITYSSYTPAGTIAAIEGGDFSALKTATFAETATGGVQIEGTVSKPAITVTPTTSSVIQAVSAAAVLPTFTEGAFNAGNVTFGTFIANTPAVVDTAKFSGGSLGEATTGSFATAGVTATVDSTATSESADYECLILTAATTASAVTEQGAFTAAEIQSGFYTAGSAATWSGSSYTAPSKAADTFTQGSAATFKTAEVLTGATAALDNAPAFTGKNYVINTTADTALKTVAFAGTAADIKATKVEYSKQEVSSATFTGSETAITATFSGSVAASILTTAVNYDKADATAAYSVKVTPEVSAITSTAKTISITVE